MQFGAIGIPIIIIAITLWNSASVGGPAPVPLIAFVIILYNPS